MTEKSATEKEVVIVGGGPAAISAAIWCADLGLKAVIIERSSELGGQLLNIHNHIRNYPGLDCENGRDLRDLFVRSLTGFSAECVLGAEISEICTRNKLVMLRDGRSFQGKALIIASGVRRRELGVTGEDRFAGKGLLESGARDPRVAMGKRVAVVGGGDAAVENALLLSEFADQITLIHRGPKLSARSEFTARAQNHAKIEILLDTTVQAFNGGTAVEEVELLNSQSKSATRLSVDLAIIRVGVVPNTELLRGKIDLDPAGYAIVNTCCETSVPGIYAIGDVANPSAPTIAGAVGTGATAAKTINACLYSPRCL